jgi:hypothetical protein
MATKNKKKHPKPARVRPRTGVGKAKLNKKLDISGGYIAAQAQNDTANKLQPQAQRLVGARTNLTALLGKRVQIQQEKNANDAAIVLAVVEHDTATTDYAQEAAVIAAGDRSVLATYGVAAAADGVRGANDQVGVTSKLAVVAGAVSGEAVLRCKKVPHAGAYLFEYKLEPSQPSDPWLPQGGILTTHVETTVGGLAPEQLLRGRVRAIGGVVGGWSEEVTGRAK